MNFGFLVIKNHGMSPELRRRMFAQTEVFFALPPDAKNTISMDQSPHFRGYSRLGERVSERVLLSSSFVRLTNVMLYTYRPREDKRAG